MKADRDLPVVFLMGPTTAGKTRLAVDLRAQLPIDIISVDSAMVYRGMNIGTAKPSAELLALAPHRLIDICDPLESYSAASFSRDALAEIEKSHGQHRIPLLVGGTGLYFRALEQGLSRLPPANRTVRQRLEQEAITLGPGALYERLSRVDPEAAGRIHRNDPQRIQRALEVYELTGRPMSEHYRMDSSAPLPFRVIKIVIAPAGREVIHQRIVERFHQMLEAGLVDEVQRLYARGDLHAGLPSMRLVGYRQVGAYLAGQLDYPQMVDHAIVATRQLAKRQLTWLRREGNAQWFDSQDHGLTSNLLKYLADKIPDSW